MKLLIMQFSLISRFEIGHMYVYNFLLKMTDTMTSQNIDLCS
jgi:hypothetical protein